MHIDLIYMHIHIYTHIYDIYTYNIYIYDTFCCTLETKVKITQLCPTLCDPMDYTVRGILQARILEWVAFPFSRGSPQTRD